MDVPADAWLPSNSHAVIWQGQKDTYYYNAGVTGGKRRVYDLISAVADKPKKSVSAARKVLHKFLRLVDQAEKRGLTLRKERAKLSPPRTLRGCGAMWRSPSRTGPRLEAAVAASASRTGPRA